MEAQNSDLDSGHVQIEDCIVPPAMDDSFSQESSTSDCSPSLVYGKTLQSPRSSGGALLAKGSSSLIFPTGVEAPGDVVVPANHTKRRRINLMLDQCETVRFPFKKRLILENLNLAASDIPVKDLVNTSLGNSLYKLSLAGNRLVTIPPDLVQCLPVLHHLDLSQCELYQLPNEWNLPKLKRLNLSHNRISEFPDEVRLRNVCLCGFKMLFVYFHSPINCSICRLCWKDYQNCKI
jgi:Leucine-rich repeat (LRR) protein